VILPQKKSTRWGEPSAIKVAFELNTLEAPATVVEEVI
jgi:hypothetical protein